MGAIKNGTLDFEDLNSWPALLFTRAYDSLMNVLYKLTPLRQTNLSTVQRIVYTSKSNNYPSKPKISERIHLVHCLYILSCIKGGTLHWKIRWCIYRSFIQIISEISGGLSWLVPSQTFTLKFPSIPFHVWTWQIFLNTKQRYDLACKPSRQ